MALGKPAWFHVDEVDGHSAETLLRTRPLPPLTLASDLSMHCIGRQIGFTRPGDRAAIK
jgi:hypothetical protein